MMPEVQLVDLELEKAGGTMSPVTEKNREPAIVAEQSRQFWTRTLTRATLVGVVALATIAVSRGLLLGSHQKSCRPTSFEATQELYDAVDRWLAGEKTSNSKLAATYGYPIGLWDVSKIQDFSCMFDARGGCNPPYGRNPSAASFNDDISQWDVSRGEDMSYMFYGASSFNGTLSNWDVSHVANMFGMFSFATSFSQDLSRWDVSHVTDMHNMFFGASSFNGNISNWDVSGLTDLLSMFEGASSFEQNLCAWGGRLPPTAATRSAFNSSGCPEANDPNLLATPVGPFCHSCE